jgi:hypothetical protein
VSAAHVRWAGSGEAEVTLLDGDRITLLSTVPHAPGARREGALASGAALRIKVARCRRQDDRFSIEGRLLDATRETRAEIQRLLDPRAG